MSTALTESAIQDALANLAGWAFTDGTIPAGIGTEKHGMGSTVGDYDGDGDLDWFVTSVGAVSYTHLTLPTILLV